METIKETLFRNWNFMRFLRLGVGIFIGIQSLQYKDTMLGLLAAFVLFQAITNTGCCGAGGCKVPPSKTQKDNVGEIEFEEIKQ